jgi:hypothetical protein
MGTWASIYQTGILLPFLFAAICLIIVLIAFLLSLVSGVIFHKVMKSKKKADFWPKTFPFFILLFILLITVQCILIFIYFGDKPLAM